MNEIGKRQVREALLFAKRDAWLARAEAATATDWIIRACHASWCALTGRHAWGEWRKSTTFFVPPETRYCSRCSGREYRGEWPSYEVRFEVGSTRPAP